MLYKEKTLNKNVMNVYSSWKKSQTSNPKEFEIVYFTFAAVDVLNKTEELNSKLHCIIYYCSFKKKMKRIDPFPTDIFSLYPSQDWGLFRVHYWQPICEEIYKDALKTMFIPVNR